MTEEEATKVAGLVSTHVLLVWYAVHAIAPGAMLKIGKHGKPVVCWEHSPTLGERDDVLSYLERAAARGLPALACEFSETRLRGALIVVSEAACEERKR